MKAMVIDGTYPVLTNEAPYNTSTIYAMQFIAYNDIKKLFSFTLSDEVLDEMGAIIDSFMKKNIDVNFNSLEMLNIIST